MKKGLKKCLSLLVTSLMLTSIVPASVMAVETEFPGAAVIQTGSTSGNSPEEAVVFENGQAILVSNTKEDVPVAAATNQSSVQLKEASPQNDVLNAEIETDSVENEYAFTVVEGGVSITKYTGSGGAVTIPSTLGGKKVLEIGDNAFRSCSSLTNINLPGSVTRIEDYAFAECDSLTSIGLPEGLTSIGERAFWLCNSLTSISIPGSLASIGDGAFEGCTNLTSISSIPESVTSIGAGVFRGCSSLTNITVEAGNLNYISIGGALFDKAGTILIACPGGKTTISIPESVTRIESDAFEGCSNLTSIIIPGSVTSIGHSAFEGCSSLTSISLPEGLTSIEDYTFGDCINLTSISLPESLTSIRTWAFRDCASLTSITIPQNVTWIGDVAFGECSSLTSINLPKSLSWLGRSVFLECSGLTSITVETGNLNYSSIGGVLFNKTGTDLIFCPGGKTSIIVPGSVTSIGDSAFSGCSSLMSVSLPESVTSIGDSAFRECSGLSSIILASGVTSIGDNAFTGCSSLTSISIPESVTHIGVPAFCACSGLMNIIVEEGNLNYKSIDGVLYDINGTNLIASPNRKTSINLPDSVTSISDWAISDCSSLTSISLPGSLTSIGDYAFCDCEKLSKVFIPASVTSIGWCAFYKCNNLTIYGVTGSYAETYAKANNIPFVGSGVPTTTLQSIAITTSAAKWSYHVGEALDLTGLVVTGTYSDGTTKIETITAANVTGFDSSKAAAGQVLTITLNGKTAAFTIQIIASEDPGEGLFTAFLGQDPAGNYYEYNATDLSNSYLAYQIKPTLPSAKMYQQFLNSECRIVALKDLTKGYMDYNVAATASLKAQMKGEAFDINAYFGSSEATKFAETVENVKIVDKDGNVS